MQLKTCLLVTDDPDDHQAFSEALSEISDDVILIVTLDCSKASLLLSEKKHIPNYIFVDLSMHGIDAAEFMNSVRLNRELSTIPVILYGEEDDLMKIKNGNGARSISKDYTYPELRSFLKEVLQL